MTTPSAACCTGMALTDSQMARSGVTTCISESVMARPWFSARTLGNSSLGIAVPSSRSTVQSRAS